MPQITKALTLDNLPAPPPDKFGWPWTEQSKPVGDRMPDGSEYPRISIVTPSYNQGQFVEETIRSVLLQGYPNLEYIIIDGGSADNSVEIIRKYEPYLTHWVSESDNGQADALNKGFAQVTGFICAYLNSDDVLMNNVLGTIANTFCQSKCHWLASNVLMGASINQAQIFNASSGNFADFVVQQSFAQQGVFWRFDVVEKPYFNSQFNFIMDYEFFIRLYEKHDSPVLLQNITAFFRVHVNSKTTMLADLCYSEHNDLVHKLCTRLPQSIVDRILLEQKRKYYREKAFQLLETQPDKILGKLFLALSAIKLLVKAPDLFRDRIFFSVTIRLLARIVLPTYSGSYSSKV